MANTSSSFLPNTDAALLAWSLNFNTLINATPTAFGLTAALATAYGTLHTAYATALAACEPSARNKSAVATKNAARTSLKNDAKLLANLVNGTASVTNAQKLSLQLTVKAPPSPIPVPSDAPGIVLGTVRGKTVKITLKDTSSGAKRGKPPGVSGAAVFSFVGAVASQDMADWTFEGNTGKTNVEVTFPNTIASGAQVWFTAFWFNGRKQSGPACDPVTTFLQGGGVSAMAA